MSTNAEEMEKILQETTELNNQTMKMIDAAIKESEASMEKSRKFLESVGSSPEDIKNASKYSRDDLSPQAKAIHDNTLVEFVANISSSPDIQIAQEAKHKPKMPRRKRGIQI